MMNVHLLRDNTISQFFANTIDQLGLRSNNYIVCYHKGPNTKHLNNYDKLVDLNKGSIEAQLEILNNEHKLFIHLLDRALYSWLEKDKRVSSFTWSVWGADLYNMYFLDFPIFLPQTQSLLNRNFRENLRKLYYITFIHPQFRRTIRKLDSVVTWMDEEFHLVQSLCNHPLEHIPFIYGKVNGEGNWQDVKKKRRTKPPFNVLVGHSAVAVGNHLDFLKRLNRTIKREDFVFYLPISYGHSNYRESLRKESKKLDLDIRFLTEFVPLNDYMAFMNEIDFFVNNSLRPLAMGNVLIAIFNQIPVFIPEINPICITLDRMKIQTFSPDKFIEVVNRQESLNSTLSANVQNTRKLFDMEHILEMYRKAFG